MEKPADTQYPILDILKRRWSPYSFSDRAVEPQKLRSLLEAARWSASSFNEQPWRFVVATKDNPVAFEKALSGLVDANQAWVKHTPVLLLCFAQQHFSRNNKPNRVHEHDLGLAMGNLTAQATSMGLFVHQMSGIDQEKIRALYGVPAEFTPVTAAAIGYPGTNEALPAEIRQRDQGPRTRKPFDEFVFGDHWQAPSPLFKSV